MFFYYFTTIFARENFFSNFTNGVHVFQRGMKRIVKSLNELSVQWAIFLQGVSYLIHNNDNVSFHYISILICKQWYCHENGARSKENSYVNNIVMPDF